ncbi:protein lin-37 homolog [Vidua chalybeata]|uniref:protein lin-37 homolog n=1 Tax=Vidua chalybeata TaxID=81927 RepID=UPI0023A7D5A7|nr:protein lin-37 homolog [Vidua chalybeata]
MMAAKVKVEKPELSPGAARRRLDAVLEQLLQRGTREPLEEEPGKGPGEPPAKEASPSAPGKRPPGRFPQQRRKKRREGGEGPETPPQKQNSFVIRLFDRSVELGQFPAGTPLYPVCRAWIGHSPAPAPPPEQAPPAPEDVLALPPPGPALAPRVPSPLGPDEGAAPPDQVLDPAPSITSLIYKNMDRWKRVRQRWREAAQRQQQRYGPSLRLLRIIYERQ